MEGTWTRLNSPVGAGAAIFPNAYSLLFAFLTIGLDFLGHGRITIYLALCTFILVLVPMYLLKEVVIHPGYHRSFLVYTLTCSLLAICAWNEIRYSAGVLSLVALYGIILQNKQYSSYHYYQIKSESIKQIREHLESSGWEKITESEYRFSTSGSDEFSFVKIGKTSTAQVSLNLDASILNDFQNSEE